MTWSTSYYHYDALGSARQLTDAVEATTDSYDYDAWGSAVSSSGTTQNTFRWNGRSGYYWDSDSSTNYVRARHYAPSLGRWLSVDLFRFHFRPLGINANAINRYLMALNNPLKVFDPSGKIDICDRRRNGFLDYACFGLKIASEYSFGGDPNEFYRCHPKREIIHVDDYYANLVGREPPIQDVVLDLLRTRIGLVVHGLQSRRGEKVVPVYVLGPATTIYPHKRNTIAIALGKSRIFGTGQLHVQWCWTKKCGLDATITLQKFSFTLMDEIDFQSFDELANKLEEWDLPYFGACIEGMLDLGFDRMAGCNYDVRYNWKVSGQYHYCQKTGKIELVCDSE